MEDSRTEVVYTKVKPGKRMLGHLIDVGIFLITSVLLFTLSNVVIKETGFYKQKINSLIQLRNDSKLYVNNKVVTTYVEDDTLFPNYEDKKNYLSVAIDEFYHNSTYFDDVAKQFEQIWLCKASFIIFF